MGAASDWKVYDEFLATIGQKVVSLNGVDQVKMALFLSTSNCGSQSLVTAQYATLTNQVANANGYATGGVVVATTWTQAGGTFTFNCANGVWNASGGSITARFAVLYDNASPNKDLICYCLLDSTPADVTATDGNSLTIQINVNGCFQGTQTS